MKGKRASAVAGYIQAAPAVAQPPQVIKWGNPFFVEPRFLFAFSAHKAHCSLAPSQQAIEYFAKELAAFDTTKNFLKLPYDQPFPEALVRKIAKWRVKAVTAREDDSFW